MSVHSKPVDTEFKALFRRAEEALKEYHEMSCEESPFARLALFRAERQGLNRSFRYITNRILTDAYDELKQNVPEDALFIQKRFFDRETMTAVAHRMNISEGYIYHVRRRAIESLTQILFAQEKESQAHQQKRWEGRLAVATYHELLGAEGHLKKLSALVDASDIPNIIVLEGIGGIGKTSLADALMRELMATSTFDDFGWVSLKTQQLTAQGILASTRNMAFLPNPHAASGVEEAVQSLLLQLVPDFPLAPNVSAGQCLQVLEEQLKLSRHLIVIDNLEEPDDAHAILPILERLMNPTQFLITSRIRLPSINTAYSYMVPPLSVEDGLRLIRQESRRSNVPHLAEYDDKTLGGIYDAVGGNPLALRLVVGLAHTQELPDILDGLRKTPTVKTEELYRYIYLQVWEQLDDLATAVLVYMPLTSPQGDPLSLIVDGVGLPKSEVQSGLDQLCDLNLVNVHRAAAGYRYSIHNLTRTFLLNDAIDW